MMSHDPKPYRPDWPPTLTHDDRTYRHTGKTGTRNADGVQSAEYADQDDRRVWLGRDGKIIED